MKKQVRLVLSAVLALSLVGAFAMFGCSSNNTTTEKKDDTATDYYACNGKYKLPCSKSHRNRFLIAVNILVYFDYHCPCLLS